MEKITIELKQIYVKPLSNGYNVVIVGSKRDEMFTKWKPTGEEADELNAEFEGLAVGQVMDIEFNTKDRYKNWEKYTIQKGKVGGTSVKAEDVDLKAMVKECYTEAKEATDWGFPQAGDITSYDSLVVAAMVSDIGVMARELLRIRLGR